jgi:HPt (histidine-containing phosphotransfer) domain-containing protein
MPSSPFNRPDPFERSTSESDSLADALNALWQKSLPLFRTRVTTIESAQSALEQGHCSAESRQEAVEEAHRLAGTLGTFGYPEGTDAARFIERSLEKDQAVSPEILAAIRVHIQTLRKIVG